MVIVMFLTHMRTHCSMTISKNRFRFTASKINQSETVRHITYTLKSKVLRQLRLKGELHPRTKLLSKVALLCKGCYILKFRQQLLYFGQNRILNCTSCVVLGLGVVSTERSPLTQSVEIDHIIMMASPQEHPHNSERESDTEDIPTNNIQPCQFEPEWAADEVEEVDQREDDREQEFVYGEDEPRCENLEW